MNKRRNTGGNHGERAAKSTPDVLMNC